MPETVVDGDGSIVWRLLGEPRRHHVLRHLDDTGEPTTTAELSRAITEYCDGDDEQVRLALRHVDVPKLADADVLEYDPDRDRIEPTPRVETLCAVLDAVDERLE